MSEGSKASVSTWRAFKVASIARTLTERYRARVPGVEQLGGELLPALDVFETAALSLRAFEARRQQALDRHTPVSRTLHARTRFWLTYVRLDHPDYQATEFNGAYDSPDNVIDRARGLLNLVDSYAAADAPYYVEPLRAELAPLFAQATANRADALDQMREWQDQRAAVRHALAPVSKGLVLLRVLLRNALGSTHPDVHALAIDHPARRKAREASADPTPVRPSIEPAPTTAQRLALVSN